MSRLPPSRRAIASGTPVWNRWRHITRCATIGFALAPMVVTAGQQARSGASDAAPLRLEVYVGDSKALSSTATFIYGRTEGILVDAQYYKSDATKVADAIAATGRHLKAIVITHSDDDHYMGTSVLLKRFPATPVYMTAVALERFKRNVGGDVDSLKKDVPGEAPDALPTAEALPTTHFLVDGEPIDIVADVQGDVRQPSNSFIWVPSIRAIIAGDIVFNGVHVWLANSTEEGRRNWQGSLDRMSALQPAIVVAGHKGSSDLPDSPAVLAFMRGYLVAFDEARKSATSADALVAAMKQRYPDLGLENILRQAARRAVPSA